MSVFEYNFEQYKSLSPDLYRKEKYNLQVELLKLQEDVIKKKRKIAICFEGRDTAGKSSTINFFSEHLIPSNFNYVHLGIPTKKERKNWFERYETYLPNKGQIVLFDRSWYTRALTEPTLGYCSKKQYEEFMTKVNKWEKSLVKKGTELVKFYFSIDKDQQKRRINARKNSKLKYWKLSESDKLMVNKWDVFTLYKNQMFDLTSTNYAPWVVINSDNKMIARLNAIRYVLSNINYSNRKNLKPKKWSKESPVYNISLFNTRFNDLSREQYELLNKLKAHE